jgi:hypothetical protein
MRGHWYATDGVLPERDLYELTDLLACRIFQQMGRRSYALSRQDIAELIAPYIDDLAREDQHALPWMVWDLLQEGLDLELETP